MKAMERMGAKEIRATVMTALEADEMLMLEIAENEQRKEFTVSEKLAFAEKLKAVEAEKAKQRQIRKSAILWWPIGHHKRSMPRLERHETLLPRRRALPAPRRCAGHRLYPKAAPT